MSLPLSLSRRILVALSMLVVATAAPSAQAPIVSIKYQSGEPIANWTKVTSSVTLEFIVQVCSPNQLSSVTASISNSGGSTGITLSDGAYANCPNGGTAYFAEATLTPDQNDINVYASDIYSNSTTSLTSLVYIPPNRARVEAPGDGGIRLPPSSTQVLPFTIVNSGTSSNAFSVSISCGGPLSNCKRVAGNVTSFTTGTIVPGAYEVHDVTVTTGVNTGSGNLSVTAVPSGYSTVADTGVTPISVARGDPPKATTARGRDTVAVAPSTSRSASFSVRNPDEFASRAVTLSATCGTLTSCTVSPSSVTLGPTKDTLVTVSFSVPSSPSTQVTNVVLISAVTSPSESSRDTSFIKVGTVPSASVTVVVNTLNPGSSVARDQCLSMAAGPAAGVECGALRVAHGTPGVRTMGVERAPTLLYLSDHSTPVVRVAAAVSVKDLTTTPDSLRANLLITGTSINRYIAWPWSPECATSAGCRIVVPLATAGYSMPTGVYDYTLEVRAGSGSPPMGSATGSVVVVDNRASAFGQGWWLEGHERLMVAASDSSRMLWIGGDGSSRVYQRRVDSTHIWTVSALVTRADTIRRVSGEYVRKLRNGGIVTFDASLRHVRTTNRQGHVTRFYYATGSTQLDSLEVPVPTSQPAKRFYLSYNSSSPKRVVSILAPSQSSTGNRTTSLSYNSDWHLTRIIEPSGDSVRFQYSGTTTSLMTARLNRLRDTTTYTYEAWGTVTQVSMRMRGSNPAITTTFCAAEGRSLATCSGDGGGYRPQPAVRTVTRIDGPRSEVTDVTRFFVGRFGAPDTLVDALGATVRLQRGNSTFPALVTRLTDAAGLVTRTVYNVRGLADTVVVEAPYGGSHAISTFSWHPKWDMATGVRSPTSELDTLQVDSTTGNRLWQRRGSNDSTKVSFSYDGYNRLTAVTTQLSGAEETFAYDGARGNLNSSTSALGIETTMASDSAGFDTDVWTPIDGTLTLRQRRIYDIMGRLARTEDVAPAVGWSLSPASGDTGTAPARTLVVKHEFDAEGQMLSVTRFTWPDSSSGKTAKSWSTYDAAGRVTEQGEWHTSGSRTMVYDPAGNLLATTSRRGLTVTQSYDPLGRVLARATPAITFADSVCRECNLYGTLLGPDTVFIPTIGSAIDNFQGSRKIIVPAEVTIYGYDAAGRMVQADNPVARIRRGYFPNGALKADTAWVRTYAEDGIDPWPSSQRSVLTYAYDLSGRRTSRTDQGTGNQTYAYDALGQLSSTTDQAASGGSSVTVHYKYDRLGRLVADSVASPANVLARWTYDVAGRPTLRVEEGFTDSLWYDERGKRTRAWGRVIMNDTYSTGTNVAYDGLGQIAATANTDTERPAVTDEFRFDGAGNVLVRHANKLSNEANTEARDSSVYLGHQLTSRVGAHFPDGRKSPLNNYSAAIPIADSLGLVYDPSGNVTTQVLARREWVWGISDGYGRRDTTGLSITSNWYDANERLRFTQLTTMPVGFSLSTRISEYRYDALGRRIAVRAMVDSIANCANETVVTPIRCQQEYLVTTWDGDQVLTESRTLGGWQLSNQQVGTSGSGDWWGTVRYTQTGAIDAPRVIWRDGGTPRILHRNWRGSVAGATFASSGSADNATVWPAVNDVWYSPDSRQSAPESNKWMGSLVTDGRDATGTLYRRNRYYDPTSGRFTQEDPIGVAGGLNLYGYGAGDPINNSDPFGLCPPEDSNLSDCPGIWTAVGAVTGALLGGAGGGGGGFLVGAGVGALPGAAAGAAQGAAFGARLGAIADGIILASRTQGWAIGKIEQLRSSIEGHLGTVGEDPNAQDANHHRGEIRGWINQARDNLKNLQGRTRARYREQVEAWQKRLDDVTPPTQS